MKLIRLPLICLTMISAIHSGASAQTCPAYSELRFKDVRNEQINTEERSEYRFMFSPNLEWTVKQAWNLSGQSFLTFRNRKNGKSFTVHQAAQMRDSIVEYAFDEENSTFTFIDKVGYVNTVDLVKQTTEVKLAVQNQTQLLDNGRYHTWKADSFDIAVALINTKTGQKKAVPDLYEKQVDRISGVYFGINPESKGLLGYSADTGKQVFATSFDHGLVQTISRPDKNGDIAVMVEKSGKTEILRFNLRTQATKKIREFPFRFAFAGFVNENSDVLYSLSDRKLRVFGDGAPMTVENLSMERGNINLKTRYNLGSSQDGKLVVYAQRDGQFRFLNLRNGETPAPTKFTNGGKLAAHPLDLNNVVLGFKDRIMLWDPYSQKKQVLLQNKKEPFQQITPVESTDPLKSAWLVRGGTTILEKYYLVVAEFECVNRSDRTRGESAQGAGGKRKD